MNGMSCTCYYCGVTEHGQKLAWNICLDCQKRPDVYLVGKIRPTDASVPVAADKPLTELVRVA
jgi:hypothetical protein